jgi:hypothetical protein
MFKKVTFELNGTGPLLMHKFTTEISEETVTRGKKDYGTPQKQAEEVAYFDKDTKKLFMPSTWIQGAIKQVSSDFKCSGNKKKTIKSVIGGAVRVTQPKIYFSDDRTLDSIEIFSSPVVVQRARVIRHRPQINNWCATVEVLVDTSLVSTKEVEALFRDAGHRVGIGDFRIAKGGPFGSFSAKKLTEIDL